MTKTQIKRLRKAARIARYRELDTRSKNIRAEKRIIREFLKKDIPLGETIGGVQHSLVTKKSADIEKLKKNGKWTEVKVERVDAKAFNQILKTRRKPEQWYEARHQDRIVVRSNHK